ncbi:MAG TPA: ATP-binding protein [Gemmatimonadales bacterium]|nr:ATP-binding protein [Gemmatimonadales bacterium]
MSRPLLPAGPSRPAQTWQSYAIAVAALAGATLFRMAIEPILGPGVQFLTYFPAVFVTAALAGFYPAMLVTVVGAALAQSLFARSGGLDLDDPSDLVGVALFLIIGTAIAWLGEARLQALAQARREAEEARRQEANAESAAVEAEESAAQAEEETLRAQDEAARAQEALDAARSAHERTHAVLEGTSDGYLGVDPDWRIRYLNRRGAELLSAQGLLPEGVMGRSVWEVWPDLLGTELERQHRRAMVERVTSTFEIWYSASQRWYEMHDFPTPDGGIGIFFRDITERRRFEERLQQAQRMDAVGRLAGGVAHEVNNQMTVVLGAASFLLRRTDLPDWARADVEQIRRAAERSGDITGQLLAFGRRQLLRPEPVDLNDVISGMETLLRRTVGSPVRLELDLAPDLSHATVDQGQISQALLNLVLNARDAMPDGGVLRVATEEVELRPGNDVDGGSEAVPGPYVLLRVSDSGIGIDPAVVGRIFEPFFTTKAFGQGTGLGLAMVYGMVRQSDGYITVTSNQGHGTTFTIYLPRHASSAVTEPAAQAPERGEIPRPDSGPPVAVVAEDEAAVRGLVSRVLVEEGFEVLEASNGAEALDLAATPRTDGRLRLVVTDLAMPKMGGRELAERLRERGFHVPLLFITGYTEEDIERLGLLGRGQEVLRKPFAPEVLADRARRLMSHKMPLSP